MSWSDFWERAHGIYVSERHLEAHYRRIGDDLQGYVADGMQVLDWGCGDALAAPRLSASGARLCLFDASAAVRARLAARFAAAPGVSVLAPEDLQGVARRFDLIVVNSVLQYLSKEQLAAQLPLWRRWLSPHGRLLLADVIPPEAGLVTDVWYLLWPGLKHGYFLAGLAGLVASLKGEYRTLRRDLGLTRYAEAELVDLLRAHGFAGERQARNVGFNQARMTVAARPLA
ncbi:MAG: methyltransferase domain-containing protein [Alphaproteobacteria bacterium]|nr:methyltransferase domain-containing protein [Alphaproteobacteria bacterium]